MSVKRNEEFHRSPAFSHCQIREIGVVKNKGGGLDGGVGVRVVFFR